MSKSAVRFALLAVCLFPLFSVNAAINRNWTGSVSNVFSEPNNWSPAGVPAPDDSLTIQVGSFTSLVNDLPAGTSFGPITFGGFVDLTGNAMTLTDNATIAGGASVTWNTDLKLGAPLTLTSSGFSVTCKSIDVNGQTLTITAPSSTTIKSLNGSGTVALGYYGIDITQDGTFSGTILGGSLNIDGSMPNATVAYPADSPYERLFGNGTLGNVQATFIYPGWAPHSSMGGDAGVVGTLKTKSLSIDGFGFVGTPTGAFFDLNGTGASDQIQVTGTVTLNNPELHLTVRGGSPATGQKFTLIDNDGADPVVGTFSGVPEGATLNAGGYTFTISYHGGDGNDVVLTAAAAVKTWTGSVNGLWSNPGNWTPNAIPVSGEPLVFPAGVTMTNDLPAGTAVGALTFAGNATLNGNALTLMGNVTMNGSSTFICNADLKIGAPLTVGSGVTNSYRSIDVNGKTLTITVSNTSLKSLDGSGTVVMSGSGMSISEGGTFKGTIEGGGVNIGASMPDANVTYQPDLPYQRVSGNGALGSVEATFVYPGWASGFTSGDPGVVGTLQTKSLTINGVGIPALQIGAFFDLNAAGASDQVQVTGTVTLNNPALFVTLRNGTPAFGRHFVIIDNDGSDPVSGTFYGLPEGAAMNVSGTTFRITYSGGDGNDVELAVATTPSAALSQGADTSVIGEPVAFTAAVTSGLGTPAGTVTFLDNGVAIGSAPLSGGKATLNISTLSLGSHTITAVYAGGGAFFGATTGPVTHTVAKGGTTTSITVLHPPAEFGSVDLRISATPNAPAAGTVSGTFTLREGTKVLGSGNIDAGGGHLSLPTLPVGTHTLIASYSGSSNFLRSDSAPFVLDVTPAPTQVSVRREEHGPTPDGTVVLKIFVLPTTSAPLIVTGMVTISENGVVLSEQPTTGALDATLRLAAGHHLLSISYSGDENFLPSSRDLELEVVGAPPARRRSARH